MRKVYRSMRFVMLVGVALLLSACAFGKKIAYDAMAPALEPAGSHTVTVATWDQRPYVVSGDKPPQFVGLSRGGYGNPFDVNTASGAALADDISAAMVIALQARGYAASSVSIAPQESLRTAQEKIASKSAARAVLIMLGEWKSDTYFNTDILFDVVIRILDAGGAELASTHVRGQENIGKGAVLDAYRRKLEQWFADPAVASALQ